MGGERDLVNFPRRTWAIDKPPVRLGIFPDEWFQALYPKTGVTGPYMALFGVSTFLCSKEYFVMEHDFYAGIALAIVMGGLIKNVGPGWTEAINKDLDAEEAMFKSIRQNEIDFCKNSIGAEESAQANTAAWEDIIAAKKEIVGLQLEVEYRNRLNEAYTGQEEAGLPGGGQQRDEAHGAEAHGGLDHWQRQEVYYSRTGGRGTQEMFGGFKSSRCLNCWGLFMNFIDLSYICCFLKMSEI